MAALDRGEHRGHGDDRLAGPDVALEQPVHRVRGGEVGFDLADRSLLGSGQGVRQGLVEPPHEVAVDAVHQPALVALHRPLAQDEDQLDPQQLVEREPPTGLLLLGDRLGQMDVREGLESLQEPETSPNRFGQRVVDPSFTASTQRLLDPSGDLPGVDLGLLALRVDRDDPPRTVADEVDDRVRHLQAAAVDVGLAEQRDLQPLAQLALAPRLVEEDHLHPPRTVTHVDRHHRAPVPGDPLGHRANRGEHECLVAGDEVGDAGLVRPIDPTAGVVREQVEQVLDTDGDERPALLVADPLEPTDVDVGEFAQGQRGHSTPNR